MRIPRRRTTVKCVFSYSRKLKVYTTLGSAGVFAMLAYKLCNPELYMYQAHCLLQLATRSLRLPPLPL